jgi:hypothetical protein
MCKLEIVQKLDMALDLCMEGREGDFHIWNMISPMFTFQPAWGTIYFLKLESKHHHLAIEVCRAAGLTVRSSEFMFVDGG